MELPANSSAPLKMVGSAIAIIVGGINTLLYNNKSLLDLSGNKSE